jgi:predicted  nucleic acid-binding Zn-ribbon protein
VHDDLQRLIRLQKLDLAADEARRAIAAIPERLGLLEAQLQSARGQLEEAKERLATNQNARRAIEKDLSVVQTRLSRFKDQRMEVKTNREYQAMQKEIETAQHEVQAFEEKILERMLEADELTAAVKSAQAALAEAERTGATEQKTLEAERQQLESGLDETARARQALVRQLPADVLAVFEDVARVRRGVALSEARDGLCSECHVRLRPQVYAEVRKNDRLIQCESCLRILHYTPPAPTAGAQA